MQRKHASPGAVQTHNAAHPAFGSRHQELLRLERQHFTEAGKEERVQRALEALERFRTGFNLDLETVKWIAQDPDIEDI